MYLTDKKGFVFWDDHLPAIWIDDLICNDSVTYLYLDSRPVDENPEVIPYLDTLIIERGEFRVFKLRTPDL